MLVVPVPDARRLSRIGVRAEASVRNRGARRALTAVALTWILALAGTDAIPAGGKCAGREGDPDCVLYLIARKCIDTTAEDYCTACPYPRAGYCPEARTCEQTTEVWTGNSRYVVIRDSSMCSCPQVPHGLVVPLGAVSGIEDQDRPLSIWKFAWDITGTFLPPGQSALVLGPRGNGTQSQLHIHLLPLDQGRLPALEATPFEKVSDLYSVWARAESLAASRGLKSFGILVHMVEGGWHIHVGDSFLTGPYTPLPQCSRPARKD